MTELVATTTGLYPLPDWAKDDLSDLKGHQKHDLIGGDESPETVDAYDRARSEVVSLQQNAGLDRVVEGQLRWDDMLAHPLTVHENVETGGIVRYYNNNNFYRDPTVVGDLTPSGDVAEELTAAAEQTDDLQAVLPGPYSLFDLSNDDYYGDDADFLSALADFLAGEVREFPSHETLFLLEPSLVVNPPASDDLHARASEAIDRVASATDAEVVVHTYWGALSEKSYAHLMDADVAGFGFDFVAGDREQTLYNLDEYGAKESAAFGLVDGQNTLVEDASTIRERVEWVRDQLAVAEFDTVYVTPNTETFYLPTNKFEAKLSALADAVAPTEVEA
jgi:5-methyltetrahydropteroyltriglutamate--homocysteine methyltransferase